MAFTPGLRLGHYEIICHLGEGGMGVVYRAADTKLGREVAIKVLPEEFARDPERLARFGQEARLLAALNHPNIAAIYGLEEAQDGGAGPSRAGRVQFLVLELVPGETLAERIGRGPLPVEEALGLARQICEALEAAHERGIIHRDLKPANIKVTPQGNVKVLDFGLAKAFAPEGEAMRAASPSPLPGATLGAGPGVRAGSPGGGVSRGRPGSPPDAFSQSPTLTFGATREGVILGTAFYMSPEQARGKPVDKRTDIWSFGCVLYEVLTGRQAFGGETASDTIAKLLEREPDWKALPARTPTGARRLLSRCLTKDSHQRLRDIGDVRIELDGAIHESVTGAEAVIGRKPIGRPAPVRSVVMTVLLATVAAATTGLVVWRMARIGPSASRHLSRLTLTLPSSVPIQLETSRPALAVSPDGSRLVYVGNDGGKLQLYVRQIGEDGVRPIPGTEGGTGPFFSPDGQWIGFFADNRMKIVSLQGGSPITVGNVPYVTRGATWGPDGTIILTENPNGGLSRISVREAAGVSGGTSRLPEEVTRPDPAKGERSHAWPEFLPGGGAVLFTLDTGGSFDEARIAILNLHTGNVKILVEGGTQPRYSPTGHIVFARTGSLLAVPFDLERLTVTGRPVTLLGGVGMESTGAAHYAFAGDGALFYVQGGTGSPEREVVWVDRQGNIRPIFEGRQSFLHPRLSPDGNRLALTISEGSNYDIWLYDLTRKTLTRLTFHPEEDFNPVWAPDGERLAFCSEMNLEHSRGGPQLTWMAADASAAPETLLSIQGSWSFPTSWSPDGSMLAFTEFRHSTWSSDISLLSLRDERKLQRFLGTEFTEAGARFSPDGRSLAYISNESGRHEVYVKPYPGPGGKVQVSSEGGTEPVWALDGRELFYRNGDRMMVAPIRAGVAFAAGAPRLLFEGRFDQTWEPDAPQNYDVAPDGRRFVMVRRKQDASPLQLNVLVNWFDELERRVTGAASEGS